MREAARMLRWVGIVLAFLLAVVCIACKHWSPGLALIGMCIGGVWLDRIE